MYLRYLLHWVTKYTDPKTIELQNELSKLLRQLDEKEKNDGGR